MSERRTFAPEVFRLLAATQQLHQFSKRLENFAAIFMRLTAVLVLIRPGRRNLAAVMEAMKPTALQNGKRLPISALQTLAMYHDR